ncbi:MAG: hypothetical protein ACRCWI_07365 [Brevinema sp.]
MKKIIVIFLLSHTVLYTQQIEFFNPTQLKRGMKGYALTVMQGLEPERMEVEVISYMPNRLPQAGLILVRLSGDNVERTRVAAGMSGSPVYIDGKLVGALAYTWANAIELLAGIVPIQDMVSDKQRGGNTAFIPQDAVPIQNSWTLEGLEGGDFLEKLQNSKQISSYPQGIEEFITVPSSRSNGVAPLKGGDAVAIKLVEGDINIASIGTVTYVDGENVYIYGHPMDGEGPVSLPLARAEIYDIMPSTRLSFKIGRALPETIGSTVFDGLSTVYGRFDKQATMIPVTFHIHGKSYSNTYTMRMARSRKYLPMLLSEGIGMILERELGKNIERQIKLSWNLSLTNDQIVSNQVNWVRHSVYDPRALKEYWNNYISILWNNDLTHFVPQKMEFIVDISEKPYNYFAVEEVKVPRKEYFAGETINLQIALQKYLSQTTYTNLSLLIPDNIEAGTYSLVVGSQLAIESELIALFPEKYTIRTTKQLLAELKRPINTHILQAVLIDASTGSILGNKFFEPMPKSKQSLFKSRTANWNNLLAPRLFESSLTMDDPVLGGQVIFVDISVLPLKNE